MPDPYYETGSIRIYHGDAREVLSGLDAEATACVTDPPYGLGDEPDPAEVMRSWADGMDPDVSGGGFMGRDWDSFVPAPNTFEAIYDSLRPGAPMFCFAGTRTADWMGMSIRFAGFERRDTVMYCFGSGLPKSLDIGKYIDKKKGKKDERVVVGEYQNPAGNNQGGNSLNMSKEEMPDTATVTAPATDEAETWNSHGTALAPGYEPVILAQKPNQQKDTVTLTENNLDRLTCNCNAEEAN